MKPSISAAIIAKDEAGDLAGCLASLKGVAEEVVVVVDETTTDATESIARAAGCLVTRRRFDDYARQRQAALELCTKEWALWIDCDERVTAALAARLAEPLGAVAAYSVAFEVRFLGRTMRHGGLGGETHVRLFRREKARFTGGQLHERLEIDGPVGRLDGQIEHVPYKDLSEYLVKMDRYTTLAAEKKYQAGERFSSWHHLILPWELTRRLLLRTAFLDGFAGVAWALLSAFHHWLKYAKLREMEDRP